MNVKERLDRYRPFRLQADLTRLREDERQMLPHLVQAAEAMDVPFRIQTYGHPDSGLSSITEPIVKDYVRLNYGPWDRMYGNEPIFAGVGSKPPGANFYPADITRVEFESAVAANPRLKSPFTMVRRDEEGQLVAIPYHRFFREYVERAADGLRQAADTAASQALGKFLQLRAEALLTDDFRASDLAWMDLKDHGLDILIGPMEIEDRLFGIKTAYAGSILARDSKSSEQLAGYARLFTQFQESLPAPVGFQREEQGPEADLQVYDALHFAGLDACCIPSGVAWLADEEVQLRKGQRSLLLRNVIQAKFDLLLMPVADLLIARDQRSYVHPDARFDFVMLHELAHGLGPRSTTPEKIPVREALGDLQHAVEEGKADVLSLHMANRLHRWGRISEDRLLALYVTSLVSLLYNYDGRQSAVRLNYFKEMGAYSRDSRTGTYRVHLERMPAAIEALAEKLLRIQSRGDYRCTVALMQEYGQPDEGLQIDIDRMDRARLPVALRLER